MYIRLLLTLKVKRFYRQFGSGASKRRKKNEQITIINYKGLMNNIILYSI